MKEILIYLDANIYMDHFDGRVDKLRPLGEFAFNVLRKTFECEFKIIFSGLILKELIYNSYEEKIKGLIKELKEENKIIRIKVLKEDINKAKEIIKGRNTNFNDTLHAVVANRMKVKYLVTRNIKDFEELQDLVKVCYPENL